MLSSAKSLSLYLTLRVYDHAIKVPQKKNAIYPTARACSLSLPFNPKTKKYKKFIPSCRYPLGIFWELRIIFAINWEMGSKKKKVQDQEK